MDGSSSQVARHSRNESHPSNESYHARHPSFPLNKEQASESSQFHPSYHATRPTEQNGLLNRLPTRHRPTSPITPYEALPKLRTSAALHFDYHTRYPSPPPAEAGFPAQTANPPPLAYPSPSSTQRSMRDQPPIHRRTTSSPSRHPTSPMPTLHRTTTSSSSADNSPMFTLPPLASVPHRLPPTQRAVDQVPNHHHHHQHHHQHQHHQHVDIIPSLTTQRRPSNAQVPRDNDNPEQAPLLRRHTVDSAHVPDQHTTGHGARKRSSLPIPNYPTQHPARLGTQPSQAISIPRPYSPPPPRRDNPPPTSAISPNTPSPSTSQPPQQLPQSPQSVSQPTIIDGPSPINESLILETVDIALEPFRSGFENVWAQAVQNVRQVMNKMQKDLTRLIHVERRKNANLMRCLVANSEKLTGAEWAVEELKKENESLKEKLIENGQLRRDNHQKLSVMDTLSQENSGLRRDNDELKKKHEEMKEALSRAAGFIFQYKEELAKAKAEVETLRKCREPSADEQLKSQQQQQQQQSAPSAENYLREMSRLHAEKERERIFNDAVKQLRALTALEDSACGNPVIVRERDSEERAPDVVVDRRISPEVASLKQDPVSPTVVTNPHDPIIDHPSANNGDASKAEGDEAESGEVEMDVVNDNDGDEDEDEDVMIIPPPMASMRITSPESVLKPSSSAEHSCEREMQPVDEPELESSEPAVEEVQQQHQQQQQRRRGLRQRHVPRATISRSASPPQTRSSKKTPTGTGTGTGTKRNREEYEEGEEGEYPAQPHPQPQLVHAHGSAEAEAVQTDGDNSNNNSSESDNVREKSKEDGGPASKSTKRHKAGKGSSGGGGRQVTVTSEHEPAMTPLANNRPVGGGRWTHYTRYRDEGVLFGAPFSSSGQQQQATTTTTPPSPKEQRPGPPPVHVKRLGINHMDLLYKTEKEVMVCRICLSLEQSPEMTTAEKRKAKGRTKKFPLNASWAELVSHCQMEHAKACEDMEKLSPSQLAEMKQRMPTAVSAR